MSIPIETLELRVDAGRDKVDVTGIERARGMLRALENQIDKLNAKLSGSSAMSAFKRQAAEYRALIDSFGKSSGQVLRGASGDKLSNFLGFNAANVRDFHTQMMGRIKDLSADMQKAMKDAFDKSFNLRNAGSASKFYEAYGREVVKMSRNQGLSPLIKLAAAAGGGGGGGGTAGPGQVVTKLGPGIIPLIIPVSQISATLGPGVVGVSGSAGGGSGGTTGGGSSGGGRGQPGGGSAPSSQGSGGGFYAESISKDAGGDVTGRTRSYRQRAGQMTKEWLDENSKLLSSVESTNLASGDRESAAKTIADWKTKIAGLSKKLYPQSYALQLKEYAGALEGMASTLKPLSGERGTEPLVGRLSTTAAQARTRADELTRAESERAAREYAQRQRRNEQQQDSARADAERSGKAAAKRAADQQRLNAAADTLQRRMESRAMSAGGEAALGQVSVEQARALEASLGGQGYSTSGGRFSEKNPTLGRGSRSQSYSLEANGQKSTYTIDYKLINGKEVSASINLVNRGLQATRAEMGLLSGDLIRNTAKVTTWAASVGILYKTLALAEHSMRTLIDTGFQTARLEQIFRGTGGSARELMDDVMALAAANGRDTKEAQQAAVQWSRLGLSRSEANMATRVSLMAANVTMLTAGEATERLTGVMKAYGLQVADLPPLLGLLNDVSNKYRVTNQDLLDGLARSSAAAKQAKIPLAELVGIIAGTVQGTGQTGANIGTAVKTMLGRFSNPAMQKQLLSEFGIPSVSGGGLRSGSDVMEDLFVKYQTFTNLEKNAMVVRLAGSTQLNRMTAVLDNYVVSQQAAINAQFSLTSAEKENALITATLKSRLEGLTSEWERFVVAQGKWPAAGLGQAATGLKNILGLMNTPVGSAVTTGALAVMGLMAGRMTIFAMRSKEAAQSGGYFSRTLARLGETGREMGGMARSVMSVDSLTSSEQFGNFAYRGFGVRTDPYSRMGIRRLNQWGAGRQEMGGFGNYTAGTAARGLAMFGAVARSTVLPIALLTGAVYAFNYAMEKFGYSADNAKAKLSTMQQEAANWSGRAGGHAQTARLYDAMSRAIGAASPDRQQFLIEQLGGMASDKFDWKSLAGQGPEAIQSELKRRSEQQMVMASGARQEEYMAHQRALKEAQSARIKLENSPFKWTETNKSDRAKLEQQEIEHRAGMIEHLTGQDPALQEILGHTAAYQGMVESKGRALEQIGGQYDRLRGSNPLGQQMAESAALAAQIRGLEDFKSSRANDQMIAARMEAERQNEITKAKANLDQERERSRIRFGSSAPNDLSKNHDNMASSLTGTATGNLYNIANMYGFWRNRGESLRKAEQTLEGWQKNEYTPQAAAEARKTSLDADAEEVKLKAKYTASLEAENNARLLARQGWASEYETAKIGSYDWGINPTERLQRRMAGAQSEYSAVMADNPNNTAADYYRAAVALNEIERTKTELMQRQFEITRERLQMEADAVREQRSTLIGGGPDTLLTMFAARGMAGGMTPGQFLTLSPEMRKAVGMYNPGWTTRGMELGMEAQQAGNISPEDFMTGQEGGEAMRSQVLAALKGANGMAEMSKVSAMALEGLTTSASNAAKALDSITEVIKKMVIQPAPQVSAPLQNVGVNNVAKQP